MKTTITTNPTSKLVVRRLLAEAQQPREYVGPRGYRSAFSALLPHSNGVTYYAPQPLTVGVEAPKGVVVRRPRACA